MSVKPGAPRKAAARMLMQRHRRLRRAKTTALIMWESSPAGATPARECGRLDAFQADERAAVDDEALTGHERTGL